MGIMEDKQRRGLLKTLKTNIMSALHDTPYIENRCISIAYGRKGRLSVEVADARTLDSKT